MYSLSTASTEGLWPTSAQLPDVHSHWLNEVSLFSRDSSQPHKPTDMNHPLAPVYPSYGPRYQEPAFHNPKDSASRPYPNQYDQSSRPYMSSRGSSPALSHQSVSPFTQTRKNSQSLIAPSLQIPRSINASRGSLSDLAAQITCLFWFESSAVLEYAADCPEIMQPNPQPLGPDTIPTPGFRKWVATIMSTTQVAQNVILLALLFIYRLKKQNPSVRGKPGSEYRLLTVALMLGNKFLDDNTYTNKTWAEVSGISVTEVHIMEVEFLSNMKYNLFTSASEWTAWQVQLGKFARYLDRATLSPKAVAAVPSYQQTVAGLPSPPVSLQTSPPATFHNVAPPQHRLSHVSNSSQARPLPYDPVPSVAANARKRSLDDTELRSAAKRVMYSQPQYQQRLAQATPLANSRSYDLLPQPTPVYPTMAQQHVPAPRESYVPPQLPPLAQQLKTPASTLPSWQSTPASSAGHPNSLAMALASSRPSIGSLNQSPYLSSNNVSPTSASHLPVSCLTPQHGQSPSVYLAQRDSPYKPIRSVHTLLVPPPARAMHHDQVASTQMHYQPLSKPFIPPQQGKLPYIPHTQWHDTHAPRHPLAHEQWWNHPIDARAH